MTSIALCSRAQRAYCAMCTRRFAGAVLLRPFVYGPKKCVPAMSNPSSRIRVAPARRAHSSASTPELTTDQPISGMRTCSTPRGGVPMQYLGSGAAAASG